MHKTNRFSKSDENHNQHAVSRSHTHLWTTQNDKSIPYLFNN